MYTNELVFKLMGPLLQTPYAKEGPYTHKTSTYLKIYKKRKKEKMK